jgi:cytochrome c peroxidase
MKPITSWQVPGLLLLTSLACLSCSDETPQATQEPVTREQKNTAAYPDWSNAEIATLRTQWLGSLPPLPPDPSNRFADDPGAAKLGQNIFFDPRFSSNGKVSCSTCHQPGRGFTDALGRAQGIGQTPRGTPGIAGVAYSPWFFWDGRVDSQWAQALVPLEDGREHGGDRTFHARMLHDAPAYRAAYEKVFGPLPDLSDRTRFPDRAGPLSADRKTRDAWDAMATEDREIINGIFANMGKAIAAYERRLLPGPGRFDHYVEALLAGDDTAAQTAMTANEAAGLRLFIGEALCVTCHQGPQFTHHGFHNVGIPFAEGLKHDHGRYNGVRKALESEFNCLGEYSDARKEDCAELRFAKTMRDETIGAFKVPSLRNVAETAPYMHSGQFATLTEVLEHYNTRPRAPIGHTDLLAISLDEQELAHLEAFLHTLSGQLAVETELLQPPPPLSRGVE